MFRVAILTVSDRSSQGQREDASGAVIQEILTSELRAEVIAYRIVPDERAEMKAALRAWADERAADLVLSTGLTGLDPCYITP